MVTHELEPLDLLIDSYVCKVAFNVIKSPHKFVILGQNQLEFYNPKINQKERKLTFGHSHSAIEQVTIENGTKVKPKKQRI